MKKMNAALLLMISIASVVAAADKPVLVNPQWVHEHLQEPDLVILQSNFLRLDFEREHIAGSRFLWPSWLAPDSPEGSFNAPDARAATALLQSLGISKNTHVVLCYVRNEVSATARMFLTLEHLGLRGQVSFLNGGLDAWKRAGYPVATGPAGEVKRGNFVAKPVGLLVDRQYVLDKLSNGGSVIVDARVQRFYDGDPTGNPRDGHITGAVNIPYLDLINSETNEIKTSEQLQSYFTPVAPGKDKELVSYCFIGQTASVVYLAGRSLGYSMKLYDGSMQEWSRIDSCPMEKSPPKGN